MTGAPAHRYETSVTWEGSTGLGWERYGRTHVAEAKPAKQQVNLTTGESQGDPTVLNPEQLVVMAAASCQLLWFLHLAAKARIDVVAYEDHSVGFMPADEEPMRLAEITLRPRIVVASGGTSERRVRRLVESAHDNCYVANSLRSHMTIEPTIELAG